MPSIISALLREQIKLAKPLLTKFSVQSSRALQEALGELGAKVVAERVEVTQTLIGAVPAATVTPVELPEGDERVALYLHGGGYVAGSFKYCEGFAGVLASAAMVRVVCVAYRLAPEEPYPAAIDDALAAYDYLLAHGYAPEKISLIGESAGGGMTLSLCLKLKALGRPLPGRIVAISPWTDLTMSGASHIANRKTDVCLTRKELEGFVAAYAPDSQTDPFVSPLFGELRGLPPCLIYVGGDEMLLDDSSMMALRLREAGVPCTLRVEPGMWHAYVLYGVPEATEALAEIREFLGEEADGR